MNRSRRLNSVITKTLIGVGSVVAAIVFIIAMDQLLGNLLNRFGYFKAMTPDTTETYDTGEFQFTATISAQGLRNPIVVTPKPKGTVRLLALGDSFTFGWGVSEKDSWVRRVESVLRSEGKHVEIINAGMPGADATEKRYICRAYADQFNVDGVILGMYADDFYQAAARSEHESLLDSTLLSYVPILSRITHPVIGDYRFNSVKPGDVIDVSSSWKRAVMNALPDYQRILPKLSPQIRSDFLNGKLNTGIITRSLNDPDFLSFMTEPGGLNLALSAIDLRMQRLKDRCTKSLPVLMVFMPDMSMVSDKYATYSAALGFTNTPELLQLNVDTPLRQMSQKYGFQYRSVDRNFRRDGCDGCYYPYDEHLTSEGNRRVTNAILPQVRAMVDRLSKTQ